MTAKTLAYATGCALLGIQTFQAVALQAPGQATQADVIADAQKEKVYAQRFVRASIAEGGQTQSPLSIQEFSACLGTEAENGWSNRRGIRRQRRRLPGLLL